MNRSRILGATSVALILIGIALLVNASNSFDRACSSCYIARSFCYRWFFLNHQPETDMFQVTLNFTTIALAVAALSKLDGDAVAMVVSDTKAAKDPSAGKPAQATAASPAAGKATAKAGAAPASTASAPPPAAAASAEAAPSASTAAEAPTIDYGVLKAAVFELSGKNQPKLAEIAASFGVKTFKDLAPAKWADALAAVQAALAPVAVEDEAFA